MNHHSSSWWGGIRSIVWFNIAVSPALILVSSDSIPLIQRIMVIVPLVQCAWWTALRSCSHSTVRQYQILAYPMTFLMKGPQQKGTLITNNDQWTDFPGPYWAKCMPFGVAWTTRCAHMHACTHLPLKIDALVILSINLWEHQFFMFLVWPVQRVFHRQKKS